MKPTNFLFLKGITYFVVIGVLEKLKYNDGDPKHPMGGVNSKQSLLKTVAGTAALLAIDSAFKMPTTGRVEAVK